jgi:hypothetical protein
MAEVIITINGNEISYDAKDCKAEDFAAVINASIYHLKSEFQDKGEVISAQVRDIKKNLESIES